MMILRHQCRRILSFSQSSALRYRQPPPHCLPRPRKFHSATPRRADTLDESVDIEGINDIEETGDLAHLEAVEEEEPQPRRRRLRVTPEGENSANAVEPKEVPKISLSANELGLGYIRRYNKKTFVRWLILDGPERGYFYPQWLGMEIEGQRVERARKRAEDRMFQRMNMFFDSLTTDEILDSLTANENSEHKENKSVKSEPHDWSQPSTLRPRLPEPTPISQLLSGAIQSNFTPQQIEGRALILLKQYDPQLHSMYRKYIDWSDYTLQKQRLYFRFPNNENFKDVLERLQGAPFKREEVAKGDLSKYFGKRIPFGTAFPFLPRRQSNYLWPKNHPYRLNKFFKPWRPIPYKLRVKMFDAWREGLGLRNVAWLGGVSWRRADGIIGILKREWDFVAKGGKLETDMAEYMDGLLEQTPLSRHFDSNIEIPGGTRGIMGINLELFELHGDRQVQRNSRIQRDEIRRNESSLSSDQLSDVQLASPKMMVTSSSSAPQGPRQDPRSGPIIMYNQVAIQQSGRREYDQLLEEIRAIDRKTHAWEASQKESLVEIPIRRTKQYFALIQEMEEYNAKRAAKALDGIDGRTMPEKEEGIKLFQQYFGGLRSLGGLEKYQGTPPWELPYTDKQRKRLLKLAKAEKLKPGDKHLVLTSKSKERVIWRFEDVDWVKQRTARPRKRSYAGTLDKRARLESGVQKYGPFGIGGGVEGVGGVKAVIERGIDGVVKARKAPQKKRQPRRELIV